MFINKEITTGQAAVLASIMRFIPSDFYVLDGRLCKDREEGGRGRGSRMLEALGRSLGLGDSSSVQKALKEEDEVETVITDSCELPALPTALWRVMRMADRKIGRLNTPVIRDSRGLMSCDDIAISQDGLWIFDSLVATWGPGKNQLDKYEQNCVASALVGRSELFCVQVHKMLDRDIMVRAELDDNSPSIKVNPDLIEWLREWVPGGYTMLKTALTHPDCDVRIQNVQNIVDNAVGHAFDDEGDFEPATTLSHITTLVTAANYAPFLIDEDGFTDFTAGYANVDLAETSSCDCGNCEPVVTTTFGYRGEVRLVAELGSFTSMPKNMAQFTSSHTRLKNFLTVNVKTAYDVAEEGITDETVTGWTELHLSANAQCSTVQ